MLRCGRFRSVVAIIWIVLTMSIAVVCLLKPLPSAAELSWLPDGATSWLDAFPDGRTLMMTLGISALPSGLLSAQQDSKTRRTIIVGIIVTLIGLETVQFWLPKRSFSMIDVAYTILGGAIVELFSMTIGWCLFAQNRRKEAT